MTFNQKCYELLSQIPEGKIVTYKHIANILNTKAYRAVGSAMAKNPSPIIVSCHRVIKSNGSIGGYALGTKKKISLLENEGIIIKKDKVVDFEKYIHVFQ
jgi:methylated-DNA-[protein]-cysteine S-methyltransferase